MSVHNRRSTRSSGRAKLSGSIEDVIRDAKVTAMQEKRAFREKKYQSERSPKFHAFMRLPVEVRACIYFLAMEDAGSPRHLPTLRAPTLALVSKQVREEALHIFLARCTFYLNVQSNHQDIGDLDEKASKGKLLPLHPTSPRMCCIEGAALDSGRCEPLSKQTRLWLLKMRGNSEELYFQNIELHITPSRCCGGHRRNRHGGAALVLSLRAHTGQLLIDYEEPPDTDSHPGLDRLRRDAVTVAHDIAALHKNYIGFSYKELKQVAKSFRYWPPGAPE
ncbi:hypothetical protein ONZ43_g2430 [Nemania bipapillata]|uniref:Uncharacterized protein n=1 Tax=Nemania bipapillata TaxID=110536 RepID=A0ACC2J0L7_9PEZI|nr:hypothetical protein ONZ43_g2430 [Nemania bipapillata]